VGSVAVLCIAVCSYSTIITINVPVVFMARYVLVLRRAISLLGALEGVGPPKIFASISNFASEAKVRAHPNSK
jgi:hypothetical protein